MSAGNQLGGHAHLMFAHDKASPGCGGVAANASGVSGAPPRRSRAVIGGVAAAATSEQLTLEMLSESFAGPTGA